MTNDIVLLGDCIATGNDVLLPEILQVDDCVVDSNGSRDDYEKQLVKWFLQNNKTKVDIKNIIKQSYLLKITKEKSLAWPSYIKNCKNFAVVGETFQGMHKKIKQYVAENPKPKLVIITDYSYSHRCVVVNWQGKKFVVKRDLFYLNDRQDIWPKKIYSIFVDKVHQQEKLGKKYQFRKTQKSFNQLIKFLNSNEISYKFCVFRLENTLVTDKYIDFTNLQSTYQNSLGKDVCSQKLAQQVHMANAVLDKLSL